MIQMYKIKMLAIMLAFLFYNKLLVTKFKNPIIIMELEKSIRNAPTIGNTKKALGAVPYLSTTAVIFAIPLGVAPIPNPQCPAASTAPSKSLPRRLNVTK